MIYWALVATIVALVVSWLIYRVFVVEDRPKIYYSQDLGSVAFCTNDKGDITKIY